MDEELKAHLEAMESRLMGRINISAESILNRVTALEEDMASFRDDMTVLSAITMRVEGSLTALTTETRAMHSRHSRLERRVTKLEGGET